MCKSSLVILLLALTLPSVQPRASDGVIEINHTCAQQTGCVTGDGAGYPVSLRVAGAYRLTSNLSPGASTGIEINAVGISIDLNGFEIAGSYTCSAPPCTAGTNSGIDADPAFRGTRVANGSIRGFGLDGIRAGASARIESVAVLTVGRHGLNLGAGSLALENAIDVAGQNGMLLGAASLYRDNTLRSTGARSVEGGRASGSNQCTDGACGSRGLPLFYLTRDIFPGDQALTACAAGFHMASFWEIHDLGAVEYDTSRGLVLTDGGNGPPAAPSVVGWVRTGGDSGLLTAGSANCLGWTQAAGVVGTLVGLSIDWDEPSLSDLPPWMASTGQCNLPQFVWCVQD